MFDNMKLSEIFIGVQTSSELFQKLNSARDLGVKTIIIDDEETITLSRLRYIAAEATDLGYTPKQIYQTLAKYVKK